MYRILFLVWVLAFPSLAKAQTHAIEFSKGVNQKVVKEWVDSLAKVSNINSTTYIRKKVGGEDRLHRSGHRDVIVWIPGTTDLTRDFIVILWFHGHWGYVPHRTFQDRTLKQFVPYAQPGNLSTNFVVVIPEMPWSVHTRTPTKRNSMLWMKPGDFMKFTMQIERILLRHMINTLLEGAKDLSWVRPLGKIDYRVVGHSAGGSAIKRIAITGDLCRINPSMIVWSDSSYGRWLDDAWNGCLGSAKIPTEVFVRKFGPPWRSATRFIGEFQGQPPFLHLHIKTGKWSHKTIGNNIVTLSGILD